MAEKALTQNNSFYGFMVRDPYPSELEYYKYNPRVAGMAAEDNAIVMNPYSNISPEQKKAVMMNEATRLYLRNKKIPLDFQLTDKQLELFQNYSNDENDIKSTIIGRLISGDPSGGEYTEEQKLKANQLRNIIFGVNQ